MVALAEPRQENAPRIPKSRAWNFFRSTTIRAENRVRKTRSCIELRQCTGTNRRRLESFSKDPIGFVDGPNLYRAYFVPGAMDPMGLAWAKVNCHKVSVAVGGSGYEGLGGSGSISIGGEVCDCCDAVAGKYVKRDTWNVSVVLSVKLGIGLGGHVRIAGYYISPGKILGPQYEVMTASGGYEKPCGTPGHWFLRSQKAIDLSVSGGIGGGFGASARAGIKGFVGGEVEFVGRNWTAYGFWGWSASGHVSVHLMAATYTKNMYWKGSKGRILIGQGAF